MHLVVGAHRHPVDPGRDAQPRETTRERLLAFVGMEQDPRPQHGAVGRHDVPLVRVVVPAGVGMAHRDVEIMGARGAFRRLDIEHVGLPGDGVGGHERQHEKNDRRSTHRRSSPWHPSLWLNPAPGASTHLHDFAYHTIAFP